MDFGLTEEQTELAGLTRKILAEREAPWGDLAAAGVLAAGLPVSLGGAGPGLLGQCSVLIELGRAARDRPYLASVGLGGGAGAAFGAGAEQGAWGGPRGRGGRAVGADRAQDRGGRRARGGPVPGAVHRAGRGAGVPGGAVGRRGERGAAAADGFRLGGPGGARRLRAGRRPGACRKWARGRG